MGRGRPLYITRRGEMRRALDNEAALWLAATAIEREALLRDMEVGVVLCAAGLESGDCFSGDAFAVAQGKCRRAAQGVANDFEALLRGSLEPQAGARQLLQRQGGVWASAAEDLERQGRRLLTSGALALLSMDELRHYPRYSRAMLVRAERVAQAMASSWLMSFLRQ